MSRTICRTAAFAVLTAGALHAQENPSDSVDVRRGDTLWGLAAARLGSPYRWPSILEVNADRVADPHWIYPGQRLRMPGAVVAVAGTDSVAPAPAAAPVDSETPSGGLPTTIDWMAKTDAAAAPAPAVVVAPKPIGWPGLDTASRLAVVAKAPYVAESRELDGAGTVIDDAEPAARGEPSVKRNFGLYDRVVVTLPRARKAGESVILVRRGRDIVGRTVVVPTAIAHVEEIHGDLATVRLVRVFDAVERGQQTIPFGDVGMWVGPGGTRASTRTTRVEWIGGSALLPTIGSVVILGSGSADRVAADDVFELVGDDRRIARGSVRGARVALAKVIRVTPHTSTAIVIAQDQAAIVTGMKAQPLTR